MKLSKEQFCKYVKLYEQMTQEEEEILNVLGATPEWTPGTWISDFYMLLRDICELEEDPITGTPLDWFCHETDFGHNERMNVVTIVDNKKTTDTEEIKVNSPEVLYDLITEGRT